MNRLFTEFSKQIDGCLVITFCTDDSPGGGCWARGGNFTIKRFGLFLFLRTSSGSTRVVVGVVIELLIYVSKGDVLLARLFNNSRSRRRRRSREPAPPKKHCFSRASATFGAARMRH